MNRKFTYIDGVTIAVARRVAEYVFGDSLIRVDKNEDEWRYDVHLMEGVDDDVIQWYKKFWGGNYKVFINKTTEAQSKSEEA